MHPIVTTIQSLLKKHAIPYSFLEHEAGRTSEEMVKIRKDFSLSEGAKALIVAIDSGFVQVVVPGDKKFANAKLRKITGTKNIRFATEKELAEITDGILPGAVPPFGNLFSIKVYADKTLLHSERIVFNCGERTASIAMSAKDYLKAVEPEVVDVVREG